MTLVAKAIPAFILAALASLSALAQSPPLEIKGLPLGASAASIQFHFPGAQCRNDECYYLSNARDIDRSKFGPAYALGFGFDLVGGAIARAYVDFHISQFTPMLAAIREKYGPESGDRIDKVQTKVGAIFESQVVFWKREDGSIELRQRVDSINESQLSMQTATFAAEVAKREAARAKTTAKAL